MYQSLISKGVTKKTIKHAQADVGMIFTAYNLRRIFNTIDKNLLKEYLREAGLMFFILKHLFKAILSPFNTSKFWKPSTLNFSIAKIIAP
jgi:ABC-type arginine transport system ATPase subunit